MEVPSEIALVRDVSGAFQVLVPPGPISLRWPTHRRAEKVQGGDVRH